MAAAIMKHNNNNNNKEQKWSPAKESMENDNREELDGDASYAPIDVRAEESESSSPYKMASDNEIESEVVTSGPRVQGVPLATGENFGGEEVNKRSSSRSSDYEKLMPNGFVSRGDSIFQSERLDNTITNNDNNSNNNADDDDDSDEDDDVMKNLTAESPNVKRKRNFGWNWMNGSNEANRGSPVDEDDDDVDDVALPKEEEDCADEHDMERDGDYEECYHRYVNLDANFHRKGNRYVNVNVNVTGGLTERGGDEGRAPKPSESPSDDKFVLFENVSYDDDDDDTGAADNDNVTRHDEADDYDVIEASLEKGERISCPAGSSGKEKNVDDNDDDDDDDDDDADVARDDNDDRQRAGGGLESTAGCSQGSKDLGSDDVMILRRNDVEEFQFGDMSEDFQNHNQSDATSALNAADRNDDDDDGDDDDGGGADNDDSPNEEVQDEADKLENWKEVQATEEEVSNLSNITITILHSPHHYFFDDEDNNEAGDNVGYDDKHGEDQLGFDKYGDDISGYNYGGDITDDPYYGADKYGDELGGDKYDDELGGDKYGGEKYDGDVSGDRYGGDNHGGDIRYAKYGDDKYDDNYDCDNFGGEKCGDAIIGDNYGVEKYRGDVKDDDYGGDVKGDDYGGDVKGDDYGGDVKGDDYGGNDIGDDCGGEKYGDNVNGDDVNGDDYDYDGHLGDDECKQRQTREDEINEEKLEECEERIFHQGDDDDDDDDGFVGGDDDDQRKQDDDSDHRKNGADDDHGKLGCDSELTKRIDDSDPRRNGAVVRGDDSDHEKLGGAGGSDLGKLDGADSSDLGRLGGDNGDLGRRADVDNGNKKRCVDPGKKLPPVPAEKPRLKIRGAWNSRTTSEDLETKRTSFKRGMCCTEPQQALEILRTSYKLNDVNRRSTKSIWTSVERPKRVTVSGITWAADTGTCKSLDAQIYSGTSRLSEMRKKIEAREQKLNDLTIKIIEGRGRPANERSKKKGDGPVTEGDGAPSKAATVSRGEEQKSFGQNLMSRCDLGKADEITVVREEVVVEPAPKKSKTKKKSNFLIKTFRSIKKKLYN